MNSPRQDITIRSVSALTRSRLVALRFYTRLTYGSLIDDAVGVLWDAYETDGQEVPFNIDEAG